MAPKDASQEEPILDTDTSLSAYTNESDLSDTSRNIHIVTTASLPWMTGTAVNPLLRALYFAKSRTNHAKVTLMIPWVENEPERISLYGAQNTFSQGRQGRKEQECYVRTWARDKAGMEKESQSLRIQFYAARYLKKVGSIMPLVDICSLVREDDADVAILEEPEHLNWLALPAFQVMGDISRDDFLPTTDVGWTQKFNHVVGIVHTNYPAYVRSYGVRGSRRLSAKTIHALNVLVCRAYCHKLVKLSATLPVLAKYKETVCNVHGVREDFLSKATSDLVEDPKAAKVYFIGKVLWAKGFDFLLRCQDKYRKSTGEYFQIDIYGGGPDLNSVKRAFLNRVLAKKNGDIKTSDMEIDEVEEDIKEGQDDHFYNQLSDAVTAISPDILDEIAEEELNESASGTSNDEEDVTSPSMISSIQTLKDSISLVKNLPKDNLNFEFPKTRYEFRKTPIPSRFLGPKEHSLLKSCPSKIFLNPSITEVLCTTTAEALAMGKFVILPVHPSNEFFYQFPNCLAYKNMDEFVEHMKHALSSEPKPLSKELKHIFTWEAAMQRLVHSAAISEKDKLYMDKMDRFKRDKRKAFLHKESGRLMKGDVLRSLVGNPPKESLADYEIDEVSNHSDTKNDTFLSFDSSSPKVICAFSFILAIISYFLQS